MDEEEISSLEERIEKHLKTCLIRWRSSPLCQPSKKTFFNRSCTLRIKKILPRLEERRSGLTTGQSSSKKRTTRRMDRKQQQQPKDRPQSSSSDGSEVKELLELQSLYKMTGFPLNLSFSNLKAVSDAVLSTGVHQVDSGYDSLSSTTEFVVAVYVHAYPCNIISLWVYVASLQT